MDLFSYKLLDEDSFDICCICLESKKENTNVLVCKNCSNSFHSECLKNWLEQKQECPYCRYNYDDIEEYFYYNNMFVINEQVLLYGIIYYQISYCASCFKIILRFIISCLFFLFLLMFLQLFLNIEKK